jgi:hypothetical protein
MARTFGYAMSDYGKANDLRARTVSWLQRKGQALLDRLNMPIEEATDLLMGYAGSGTSEKREVDMNDTQTILKNLRSMGEHQFSKILGDYARQVHPTLPAAVAFAKIFTEDSPEGIAIRRAWLISKGQGLAATSALDESDVDDANDEIEGGALERLEELAAEERRRNPGMSKAAAFSKVYIDPANARLAQRERQQNRPRA